MVTHKPTSKAGTLVALKSFAVSLFVLSAIVTSQVAKGAEGPETYWPDTSLNLFLAMEIVNGETCYKSEIEFLGCVNGINELAKQLDPAAKLQPVSDFQSLEQEILQMGPVALVELESQDIEGLSTMEIWEKTAEKRDAYNARMANLYQASQMGQVSRVSFENLLVDMSEKLQEPERQAEFASYVVNGFLKVAVDPHTYIIPADYIREKMASSSDSYAGVGMHMMKANGHVILNPMEDRPAMRAGVQAGDILTHVEGQSVTEMSTGEIVGLVKGPEGTTVKITVLRDGESLDIRIERKVVTIENVTYKMVDHASTPYGYIKIRDFSDKQLCQNMENAIRDVEARGARGLILDLRGNPGGLLTQAICVGGLFIGKGKVIVKVRNLKDKNKTVYRAESEKVTDLPMVTLIDGYSASASEILSGALQDHQRSWVMGEQSYGKGSVQSPQPFLADFSVLLFKTIQVFYQPLGRTNQATGIYPDFVIPFKPGATEEERFVIREGDLYTNAIAPDTKEWVQRRPEQVVDLEQCMIREGVAQDLASEDALSGPFNSKYQMYKAQDLLNCML